MKRHSSLTGLGLCAMLLGAAAPADADDDGSSGALPFQRTSEQFLSDHGFDAEQPPTTLNDLVQRAHVRVDVGLYEVHYPRTALRDAKSATQFIEILSALLDLQDHWIALARPPVDRKTQVTPPDLAVLKDWVKGVKSASVKSIADHTQASDLFELLRVDGDVRAAAATFASSMRSGASVACAIRVEEQAAVRLVFAPTRSDFLGIASTVGNMSDAQRDLLWVPTLPRWTEFRWSDIQVIALEYASPDSKDWMVGFPMGQREKTGVLQHVLQHATDRLCRTYYGEALDPAVRSGLAILAVIDLLGENNARAGGSGESNQTAAVSKFVPGFTNGGHLPPVNADSKWREKKGRDVFKRTLKMAQKDGKKMASREVGLRSLPTHLHFALDAKGGKKNQCTVTAPFLGSDVPVKVIPDDSASDYREFFRVYKTAFVAWLRDDCAKRLDVDARQTFADLLARTAIAHRDGSESFASVVEDLYGLPLGTPDPKGDSVEREFLEWLQRGR